MQLTVRDLVRSVKESKLSAGFVAERSDRIGDGGWLCVSRATFDEMRWVLLEDDLRTRGFHLENLQGVVDALGRMVEDQA